MSDLGSKRLGQPGTLADGASSLELPHLSSDFKGTWATPPRHPSLQDMVIGDPTTLIIIDETDRLRMASLEQVRAILTRKTQTTRKTRKTQTDSIISYL